MNKNSIDIAHIFVMAASAAAYAAVTNIFTLPHAHFAQLP
jgi:hypothetical protein